MRAESRLLAAILVLGAGTLVFTDSGSARGEAQPFVIQVDPGRTGPVADAVVRTLAEAMARVVAFRARSGGETPVVIELAAGLHRLERPIRIGPDAGGLPGAPLILRGSKAGTTRITRSVPLRRIESPAPA